MYLEGENSFHPHLWMLSCGNDLSKLRTFSSLFYSPERKLLFYSDTNQELAWIFSYSVFLFFILESFHSLFPFLFVLNPEIVSPLLFFLWTFTILPEAHCLSTFLCSFCRTLLLGGLPLILATAFTCCIHTHFPATSPATLFVAFNCLRWWDHTGGIIINIFAQV